ncbi:MAG TPA: ion transporter, partial [Cellvibrionaceae bacterium]|nr:ion transporter [Cellvibrionaceae bacterium]
MLASKTRALLVSRAFRLAIGVLIILSMVSFSFDTVPDLDPTLKRLLDYFECFTIGVFTLEYFARITTAQQKLKFVFSFYGLIDLVAILPFYLMLMVDLR